MLLTRISRIARSARAAGEDDRGVALAAVLIFMAAGILLSSVVASSVVTGMQFSASTRADVQSQAAAEAGIAVARAALIGGQCVSPALYESAGSLDDADTTTVDESSPKYSAQVQYSTDGGTSWISGCPASVQQAARILSTGYALVPGLPGDTSGDTTTIEARLATITNQASLNPSGPAVYSYNTSGFGGSGKLISSGGYDTSIMIRSGDVTCDGAANGAADLVIKSGNFTGTGSCVITGNVWVNGKAELKGGAQIGGSVTAGSVDASGSIGGNVYADTTMKLSWGANVTGWATAATLDVAGGQVAQSAWARTGISTVSGGGVNGTLWSTGAATVSNGTVRNLVSTNAVTLSGGEITTSVKGTALTMTNGTLGGGAITGAACFKNGTLNGALKVGSITTSGGCYSKTSQSWWGGWSKITTGSSPTPVLDGSPSKPSAVVVPDWVDFGADPADLTPAGWAGYTLVTMGTDCSDKKFYAALQVAGSNPALIDARACSNGLSFSGGDTEQTGQGQNANGFRLRNNVAIIGSKLSFAGSARFFANSGTVNLWLINPDTIPNQKPDCNGQSISVGGGFSTTNVNVMFYTPCEITLGSSTTLKGQIFAGSNVKFNGAGLLDYIPLGLPGYDLDTGYDDGATYTEADRSLLWQRNVTDAG